MSNAKKQNQYDALRETFIGFSVTEQSALTASKVAHPGPGALLLAAK